MYNGFVEHTGGYRASFGKPNRSHAAQGTGKGARVGAGISTDKVGARRGRVPKSGRWQGHILHIWSSKIEVQNLMWIFRQDLTHQLHATASELQAARNSWPWLSKTLSSIKEAATKEAANKREAMGSVAPTVLRDLRRDSAPGGDFHHLIHSRSRETRDSLKEVVWCTVSIKCNIF